MYVSICIYLYTLINGSNNNYFLRLEVSCLTFIYLRNVKHETSSRKK